MKLRVLNSDSSGNSYILDAGDSALIIEAGVPVNRVKRELDYKVNKIVGCLVTHEHGDHAGRVKEYMKNGIRVYASPGTVGKIGVKNHHNLVPIPIAKYQIGDFEVRPFDVIHDVAQPYGYLIRHEQCGKVLFVTDSQFLNVKFPGLNNIILETNYCEDILDRNERGGRISPFLADRIRASHMSIQTAVEFLKMQDLAAVNNIVLSHLSSSNSNAGEFKQRIETETLKNVYVADRDMIIPLGKSPF